MDVPLFVSWLDAVRKMPCFNLRSLSLVVDDISDDLLIIVVHSLPRLVELDIEGQTFYGAIGTGLDQHWTAGSEVLQMSNSLSIVLSERNYPSFKRVKIIGMFYVSEGCRWLEFVKLGRFAKVKKFEVLTSPLLSDLVFDNMIGVPSICTAASVTSSQNPIHKSVNALATNVMLLMHNCTIGKSPAPRRARSVIELRFSSCSLLTSEASEHLSSFIKLEMLMDRPNHNSSKLERLVLSNCRGLSTDAIMLPLPQHTFRGLLWLCVGLYHIVDKRDNLYAISKALPRLVGCKFGCFDGWQWHKIR
ncbi:hypothetical protein CQW23_18067 [Capsicum baccatum]|uniref:F-box/LRR-repeat protein 15-like leucin rich repeat domain-containing protein n=1 Tax=Capsicum baccatum TaxID=33114 RepID=A0A2G2WFN0_CAPBA|nr:hypothetical protein CQW23_18067 [Capsicum baccatum]